MDLSIPVVLTPRRPATVLELWTPRFFEMLMNGFSKHSNNIFTRTSRDAKCFVLVLVIYVLDFQKNFSKEKTKFFSVDANTKMSISKFTNGHSHVLHKQSQ